MLNSRDYRSSGSWLYTRARARGRVQALVWCVFLAFLLCFLLSAAAPPGIAFTCIQLCSLAFALFELPNPTRERVVEK